MKEQMSNVSRGMEILRTKKKCQRSKTQIEIKNAFDGLISRQDTAEGRISDLGDIAIEISNIEKQIEKKLKKKKELQDNYKKCNLPIVGMLEKKKETIFETIIISSKLISDIKPQVQEAQITPSKKLHLVTSFSNYRK